MSNRFDPPQSPYLGELEFLADGGFAWPIHNNLQDDSFGGIDETPIGTYRDFTAPYGNNFGGDTANIFTTSQARTSLVPAPASNDSVRGDIFSGSNGYQAGNNNFTAWSDHNGFGHGQAYGLHATSASSRSHAYWSHNDDFDISLSDANRGTDGSYTTSWEAPPVEGTHFSLPGIGTVFPEIQVEQAPGALCPAALWPDPGWPPIETTGIQPRPVLQGSPGTEPSRLQGNDE